MKDEKKTNGARLAAALVRRGEWRNRASAPAAQVRPLNGNSSFGFTLIELLTVLIIITILIGILIPTVSAIRRRAYNTNVQGQMSELEQALNQYYADFHSYPGPVANQVMGTVPANNDPNYIALAANVAPTTPQNLVTNLTGPENLVLGLIGGLIYPTVAQNNYAVANQTYYDPNLVGQGANSLNTGLPKKFGAYIATSDLSAAFLSSTKNGLYGDGLVPSGTMSDSQVPEILDRFPNKMPILYIRANPGAAMYNAAGTFGDDNNPVVINAANPSYGSDTSQTSYAGPGGSQTTPLIRYAEYDISQIIAYTQSYNGACIGEGKTLPQYVAAGSVVAGASHHGLNSIGASSPTQTLTGAVGTSTFTYPYPAYPYFKDPNSPAYSAGPPQILPYARAKDSYILISAGSDRVYGTADDITSFGDVRP